MSDQSVECRACREESVDCRACRAGLELVWSVQCKKTRHLGQGLSIVECLHIDARERRLRNACSNEGPRG